MEKSNPLVSTPIAIVIGSVLISLSILISGGAIKIKGFADTTGTPSAAVPTAGDTAPVPEPSTGPATASIDDDPVLGSADAPVTIIEFSDYECPFCKRHYDQTFAQLKTNYIDTGKVKLVFRDLPLSFHDPLATTAATAANCAREQGGDPSYWKLHDEYFKTTTSNGDGVTMDQLYNMANTIGINQAQYKSCIDSKKYDEEIAKDLADANNAGATGTPSFIVAKSTGKEVTGKLLVGAQPYTAFQMEIDSLLK